jgi:NAD(P)-dependent dehydrogenase (short-subunit alcohol dehydrogenase family)
MATPSYDYSGKSVLVFGGATGIGRATSLAFAAAGAAVTVAGLGAEHGRGVEVEIIERGGIAHFIECDVCQEAQVDRAVSAAIDRHGRLDYAINNAGIESRYAPLQDATSDEFDRIIATNLKGVWLGMKYEIPHMLTAGGGVIVNTTSTAGVSGMANIAIYTASKHGIVGLTRAAALELGTSGIRVNAIAPGPVDTGLLSRMVAGHVPIDAIAESNPMGRISQPEEMAQVMLWLCSDGASYVNGHILVADGGMTAA